MPEIELAHETAFDDWRTQARRLLLADVQPPAVTWRVRTAPGDLFGAIPPPPPAAPTATSADEVRVPRDLIALAETVILCRDRQRFALLYTLLWRLTHGEPHLLSLAADPLLHRIETMAAAVRRDIHKMTAFVRFREISDETGPLWLTWFEPRHFVVEAVAPFFAERFANMRWSILTPDRSVHWDGTRLRFAAGGQPDDAASEDAVEMLWCTYYASIFNPARPKLRAMAGQMPRHYWRNLPETRLISSLTRAAATRTETMLALSDLPPRKKGPKL